MLLVCSIRPNLPAMNEGGVGRVGKSRGQVAKVGGGEVESKIRVALQVFVGGHRVVGNVPRQFQVLEKGSYGVYRCRDG